MPDNTKFVTTTARTNNRYPFRTSSGYADMKLICGHANFSPVISVAKLMKLADNIQIGSIAIRKLIAPAAHILLIDGMFAVSA
jgi:hypothetical protein